jgi:hypothetical protein
MRPEKKGRSKKRERERGYRIGGGDFEWDEDMVVVGQAEAANDGGVGDAAVEVHIGAIGGNRQQTDRGFELDLARHG